MFFKPIDCNNASKCFMSLVFKHIESKSMQHSMSWNDWFLFSQELEQLQNSSVQFFGKVLSVEFAKQRFEQDNGDFWAILLSKWKDTM